MGSWPRVEGGTQKEACWRAALGARCSDWEGGSGGGEPSAMSQLALKVGLSREEPPYEGTERSGGCGGGGCVGAEVGGGREGAYGREKVGGMEKEGGREKVGGSEKAGEREKVGGREGTVLSGVPGREPRV